MNVPARRDDPAQEQVREWFSKLGSEPWLLLCTSHHAGGISCGTFCALAPASFRPRALSNPGWGFSHGAHRPGFSQRGDGSGGSTTTYHRYTSEPIEPFLIERDFQGVRPGYRELSEEFRLFHNLYSDHLLSGDLLKLDAAGNGTVAAHVEPDHVAVLTSLVRQYQAARQMDLLLFIDSYVRYDSSLPTPTAGHWVTKELNAAFTVGNDGGQPLSRFLATRVLPAPPIDRSGIWPFQRPDTRFPEFIIGVNEYGDTVESTCDPDVLDNHFGASPYTPDYLTPVHFRREVLVKYYDRPDLYKVGDGYLSCSSLWGLRMDNDGPESVVVWLGDLGRDLPASERDHWRSFNVPPAGSISETAYRRRDSR